jgi:hypothetical protein
MAKIVFFSLEKKLETQGGWQVIYIRTDSFGHRHINHGNDGPENGNEITDQLIAILMGWALGIEESS